MKTHQELYDKFAQSVMRSYVCITFQAARPVIARIADELFDDKLYSAPTGLTNPQKNSEKEAIYRKLRVQAEEERWEDLRASNRDKLRGRIDREDTTDNNLDIVKTLNTILKDRYHLASDVLQRVLKSLTDEFERQEAYYDLASDGQPIGEIKFRSAMSQENQLRFAKLMSDEIERTVKLGVVVMKYLGLGKGDDDTQDQAALEGKDLDILTNTAVISMQVSQGKAIVPKVLQPDQKNQIFNKLDSTQVP